jgi:hypothetical protein
MLNVGDKILIKISELSEPFKAVVWSINKNGNVRFKSENCNGICTVPAIYVLEKLN